MIGIIGGTGFYNPNFLDGATEYLEKTRFGQVKIMMGSYKGKQVAFIPRHGSKHSIPPHLINFRANIKALSQVGVHSIIASSAVGSLNPGLPPGSYVLPDQFLDFTRSRVSTFYDGEQGVIHCDMTVPYCAELREALVASAAGQGLAIKNGSTYVCTEGPRFETAAEIKMFGLLGGDLVGMTSVPEVVLSRELGLCYATLGIVTNFAAGISSTELNHAEVLAIMKSSLQNARNIIMGCLEHINSDKKCHCAAVLNELPLNGSINPK